MDSQCEGIGLAPDGSRKAWRGILPSLPTPFNPSGGVDPAGMRKVVRFAIDCGADGLVCFGLAGEVSRLGVVERERLLEICLEEINGAVPVLTGATAENLLLSRELATHAQRSGADGVILPPPNGYRLDDSELVGFFADVASATSLPVIIQDAPEYLGVALNPEVVVQASKTAPNISAMKLETGPEGIERWRAALGDGFSLYGGNGGMFLLDCLRAGADGIMPGVDTTDLLVEIERAERRGERARADQLFERVLPMLVFELQSIDHYNTCAKHVLNRRGVDIHPSLRAPGLRGLSSASVARLESYLQRLDLCDSPAGERQSVESHG